MAHIGTDPAGNPVLVSGSSSEDFPVLFDASTEAPEVPPEPVPESPTVRPAGVGHAEWARRQDIVRDAAREFESFTPQDIKEWLRGKTNRVLGEEEFKSFAIDVRAQQMDDLVDILDHQQHGPLRGRRSVRVQAPKGYVRKTLNSLSDVELKTVARRLKARGWADKSLKTLQSKLPERRQAVLDSLSDLSMAEFEHGDLYDPSMLLDRARDMVAEMARNMPAPSVVVEAPQVTVQAPPPPPAPKLKIERDERGFLTGIQPETNGV